jgi:hypothetical protein
MKNIIIRGEAWDALYIAAMLDGLKNKHFEEKHWFPHDALVSKDGKRATVFTGQVFDANEYSLQRKFWDHDHCEVCNWELHKSKDPEHANGYFNGYNWLCRECYARFLAGTELTDRPENIEKL